MSELSWKKDWQATQAAFRKWWKREGMLIYLTADDPSLERPSPALQKPADIRAEWTDPVYRCSLAEAAAARTHYLADSFPLFDTQIGPGSLSTFLGSRPEFAPGTVWYWPVEPIQSLDAPIRFNPESNYWLDVHLALIHEGLRRSQNRYLVGIPDLIENLDTLASLRGDTPLLFDLVERPDWVRTKLAEINQAWFAAYDLIYNLVKQDDGGSVFAAFMLWGPGKTAKLQCDISACLSPRMFNEIVVPALQEQINWLDYSMYHLDGTTCLQHLDTLLGLENLQAIEWTPQDGRPGGGSPEWFPLYRRILASGKGLQCVGVKDEEIIPLVDAVGPEGVFIIPARSDRTLAQAEAIIKALEPYRK